jgi:hypothetical protein
MFQTTNQSTHYSSSVCSILYMHLFQKLIKALTSFIGNNVVNYHVQSTTLQNHYFPLNMCFFFAVELLIWGRVSLLLFLVLSCVYTCMYHNNECICDVNRHIYNTETPC